MNKRKVETQNFASQKIPRLRFPEFKNSGGWEERVLDDFIKERKEISNENNPLYSLTIENGITPKSERYERSFLVKNEKEAYKILYPYDFAYNPMNLRFGAIALYQGKTNVALSKYYNIFYCDGSVDPRFCEFYFKSNQMLTLYDDIATGSLIEKRRVHFSAFLKLAILFPKKKEQQKIASCLSSLDELLEARKQKLELLKKHKKGLMQNLFPDPSTSSGGEKVPKLRFPEFKDSGEWEEKKLENITDAIFDGTHQTPTYFEDGIPFFSVENIVSGNKNKFISKEDYEKATSKNKPAKGDILITRIGKIGFSAIVDWDYDFSIYVTLACIKKSNYFNSYYLHCYFQSQTYQNEILSKSLLNAVPCKINMNELRQTKILLPSLPEQQKIASCLSSLDELITAEAEKIEQLEKHKKGLMQGLFPEIK